MKDYTKLPIRFQNVSYENDVPEKIKEISQEQIKKGNGIYIWGGAGVGKTHIICALANNVVVNGFKIMFFNTSDFLEQLREEYDKKPQWESDEEGLFREVMNFKGVLFLDDIGAEKASEWTRERLYLVINKRYEDMLPTIFTSNCDMEILSARMGDRITSRINGMVEIIEKGGQDRRI